jgi:hypothetical protein
MQFEAPMSRIYYVFVLFFTGLLFGTHASAEGYGHGHHSYDHHSHPQTAIYVNMNTITPPPPPTREVMMEPRGAYGHGQCRIIPAGYRHGYWVNAHKVCRYPHNEWVSPHWECLRFDRLEGICMRWNWVQGYWVKQY